MFFNWWFLQCPTTIRWNPFGSSNYIRFENHPGCFCSVALVSCKELLRNAAKARIARMVANKRKRTDLQVPGWVREQWEKGTSEKEEMAVCLQQVNWDKAGFWKNSHVKNVNSQLLCTSHCANVFLCCRADVGLSVRWFTVVYSRVGLFYDIDLLVLLMTILLLLTDMLV